MNLDDWQLRGRALDAMRDVIRECESGTADGVYRANVRYDGILKEAYGSAQKARAAADDWMFARDGALGYFQAKLLGAGDAGRNELGNAKSFYMKELLRDERFLYECFGGV